MIAFAKNRCGPIGVDLGRRSVKLLQLSADRGRVLEAARWDLAPDAEGADPEHRQRALTDGLRQLCKSRNFRGREAVLCLGGDQLFVQNIRVARSAEAEVSRLVTQVAAARVPYSIAEAEIRFIETADIRQGDTTKREVVLLACHRPALTRLLQVVDDAGLRPVAVDVEPVALLRCYAHQLRRDEDRHQRAMFVHVGQSNTAVVIAQGKAPLFVKYLDIGGCHFDQVVAASLEMELDAAALLRRHNGDRRSEQQDPEIARGVGQAIRPIVQRLANELSLCIRYHSVTFRGQPLARMVLGGGEASAGLAELFAQALDLPCQLGEPLRTYKNDVPLGRQSQWDVAAGLALRPTE